MLSSQVQCMTCGDMIRSRFVIHFSMQVDKLRSAIDCRLHQTAQLKHPQPMANEPSFTGIHWRT